MNDTQPYIDLNLYTVPLNGKTIHRNPKGKKEGFSFPTNWQEHYTKNRNTLSTPIGGLLTGREANIIAIDCDDKKTYDLFRQLDPDYQAYTDSIGKLDSEGNPIECGTIIYLYTPDAPPSFRTTNGFDLDFFNGTGMIFLPTSANQTKTDWTEIKGELYNANTQQLITLATPPQTVLNLLELLKNIPTKDKTVATTTTQIRAKGIISPIVETLDLDTYQPKLTYILTPQEYRSDLYYSQHHLHPNDINGSGYMYLFKIACILASDNTVDQTLFIDILNYINNLWTTPMEQNTLDTNIIAPIVSGRQKNPSGQPYWQYDENWELATGILRINKLNADVVDIFYDPHKSSYYVFNTMTDEIAEISKKQFLIDHLKVSTIGRFNTTELMENMANTLTVTEPTSDFGYINNDLNFNLFKPTQALRILADPDPYESEYSRPYAFINFMEHFIPSEQQRLYLIQLIRTKLTTFGYSPVVPYIIGIPGSGKGIFLDILANILGQKYVSKDVGGEMFISPFNKGFLENKFIINLNELSEGLITNADKTKARGNLKLYTGSQTFQCVGKGKDPYQTFMRAMFIMTANRNPLAIEDGDRRLYYIATPNTFESSPQCKASQPTDIHNLLMTQTNDIAYYLATEHKNLHSTDYLRAPHNEGKDSILFESLPSSQKIGWALETNNIQLLIDWALTPEYLLLDSIDNKITLKNLTKLYHDQTGADDAEHIMKKVMKKHGFKQFQSTGNSVYYTVSNLEDYSALKPPSDTTAEEIRL